MLSHTSVRWKYSIRAKNAELGSQMSATKRQKEAGPRQDEQFCSHTNPALLEQEFSPLPFPKSYCIGCIIEFPPRPRSPRPRKLGAFSRTEGAASGVDSIRWGKMAHSTMHRDKKKKVGVPRFLGRGICPATNSGPQKLYHPKFGFPAKYFKEKNETVQY